MIKYALALALLGTPVAVYAQTVTATGPVSVEIVTTGQVSVAAQRYRLSVTLTAKGKDEAAAGVALAASRAKLVQALGGLNVREAEAEADLGTTNSLMNMLASFGGMKSKPSFSLDTPLEEDSDETPQSTATEKLVFDATTRSAVDAARAPIEANGGKLDDDVLPLLTDYVGPTRQAKAAAIQKAQGEADAYAATLGLRRTTIVKVSEKQDPTAGALALIGEMVSIIAPKREGNVDKVNVNASLVVEFQLSR
jgi:uncharacterized protein YggE